MTLQMQIIEEVGRNASHPEKLKGYLVCTVDDETHHARYLHVPYRESVQTGKTLITFNFGDSRYVYEVAARRITLRSPGEMKYADLAPLLSNESIPEKESEQMPFRNFLNNPAIFGNLFHVAVAG